MKNFAGKVAVVTGAASGIGRALAVELALRGSRLAISDIDVSGLEETATLCRSQGAEIHSHRLDVADPAAFESYAALVHDWFGIVHQIFNNAGIAYYGEVERAPIEDSRRVFDVNYWGVVHGTTAFLPHLIASGDGHVVNISSVFGLVPFAGQSAYTASKFAIRGFSETLAQEMSIAGHPVRVSCVHPGGVKTAVARNAALTEGADRTAFIEGFERRLAIHSPRSAAESILEGVRKRHTRILVGAEVKALDGLARLSPAAARRVTAWVSQTVPVGRVAESGTEHMR